MVVEIGWAAVCWAIWRSLIGTLTIFLVLVRVSIPQRTAFVPVLVSCSCSNQAFTETKLNLRWQVEFEFWLQLACALFRLILLSPKCLYLPPHPPDGEAAVVISLLSQRHSGKRRQSRTSSAFSCGGRQGAELPEELLPVCASVGCCSMGMLLQQILLGGKRRKVHEKRQQSKLWEGSQFGHFTGPVCSCLSEGELLGRTSWDGQAAWSVETARERGPGG